MHASSALDLHDGLTHSPQVLYRSMVSLFAAEPQVGERALQARLKCMPWCRLNLYDWPYHIPAWRPNSQHQTSHERDFAICAIFTFFMCPDAIRSLLACSTYRSFQSELESEPLHLQVLAEYGWSPPSATRKETRWLCDFMQFLTSDYEHPDQHDVDWMELAQVRQTQRPRLIRLWCMPHCDHQGKVVAVFGAKLE